MAVEGLFEVEHPDPGRIIQECDGCDYLAWASDDALRVRGWLVFDGESEAGHPVHVRVCPACQRKRVKQQQKEQKQIQRAAASALSQPALFE